MGVDDDWDSKGGGADAARTSKEDAHTAQTVQVTKTSDIQALIEAARRGEARPRSVPPASSIPTPALAFPAPDVPVRDDAAPAAASDPPKDEIAIVQTATIPSTRPEAATEQEPEPQQLMSYFVLLLLAIAVGAAVVLSYCGAHV